MGLGISCDRKQGRPAATVTGVFIDFLRQLAEAALGR
jgi:hypothetical protein